MSVTVVEEACTRKDGCLVIVVEGKDPEVVTNSTAKRAAMEFAENAGYPRLGFNKHTGAYPVDSEGRSYEDVNEQARAGKIAKYRNEIYLMAGL